MTAASVWCVVIFLLLVVRPEYGVHGGQNEYVAVAIFLSDTLAHSGDTSSVMVKFTPETGFHVNATPPPEIVLRSENIAAVDSGLVPAPGTTDMLNTAIPLRKLFVVRGHPSREAVVKGTLRYFFCSDSDGWCARRSLDFALPLTIIQ